MKTMIFATVAAISMLASAPAFAQSGSVEGRRVDSSTGDASELQLNYSNGLVGRFDYTLEGVLNYQDSTGDVGALAAAGAKTNITAPLGFTVTPKVEVGGVFTENNNFGFWGVEAVATRPVVGKFGVILGVRHREGFDTADMEENRTQVGVSYTLTDTSSLEANFYDTNGITDSTAVGITYKTKF
jgi:hypothetical protein